MWICRCVFDIFDNRVIVFSMSDTTVNEFVCEDVRGLTIICSKERWEHLTRHGEMVGTQGVVKAIIASPEFINRSASEKNRQTYYKQLVLPNTGSTYVRVVVELSNRLLRKKKGYIINAFRCNGEQNGEVRIWTKS
jgi:hypothetical protein